MAFNLSAVLKFGSTGLKNSFGAANKSLNKFQGNVNKAGQKVKAMGPGMRNLGIMGTATSVGMGMAVKSYMDFSRQMDSVKAKMKPTNDQYERMSDLAKEMGSRTIYTAKQSAEGFEYLALAGFKAEAAIKVLPSLLYTAGAGAMELGKASDIITDSMSAMSPVMKKYGDEAKQATTLSDMLALAQASTNTNIEQLGEAITYGGGAMANMQIPLHEIIGSMGALADSGVKGSSGGTALLNMMNKLSKPSGKATKLMREMGISMDDLKTPEGKLKSMSKIVEIFNKGIEKNPDMLDKAGVASEIFGLRGQRAFFALRNKGVKNLDNLYSKLKNSKGAAKEMYNTMTDNLYGAWESIKSAVSGSVLNLGELTAKVFDLKGVIQAVTMPISNFAMALNASMKPTEKLSKAQKELMSSNIGQFASGIVDGFKSIKKTIVGFIAQFKSFLGFATDSGISFKMIGEYVTKAAVALALIGPPILALGASLLLLGPVLVGVASGISLIGTVLALLTSPVTLAIVGVGILTYGLYRLMGGWQGVTEAASTFASGFMSSFVPIWEQIKEDLMPAFNELKGAIGSVFGLFNETGKASNDFSSFGATVGKVCSFIATAITFPIKGLMQLSSLITETLGWGIEKVKGILSWMGKGKGKPRKDTTAKTVEKATQPTGKVLQFPTKGPAIGDTSTDVVNPRKTGVNELDLEQLKRTKAGVQQVKGTMPTNVPSPQQEEISVVSNLFLDGEQIANTIKKVSRHETNKVGDQIKAVSEKQSQPQYGS